MEINQFIKQVFCHMNAQNLEYCHWKSNVRLDEALAGHEDIDILVAPKDFKKLKVILLNDNFIEVLTPCSPYQKGIFHFYGIGGDACRVIHFHIFTCLITGNGMIKNFYLPFRRLLLDNVVLYKGLVKIPTPEVELIVYMFRLLSKQGSLYNLWEFINEFELLFKEFFSLKNTADIHKSITLLKNFYQSPSLVEVYEKGIRFLEEKRFFAFFLLGLKFKRLVRWHRFNIFFHIFAETKAVLIYVVAKLRGKSVVTLSDRAPIVVLVGGPASGKTTLATSVQKALKPFIDIEYFHVGKPRATVFLCWIRLFLPFFKKFFPNKSSVNVEKKQVEKIKVHLPILYILRKVMLAYERDRLVRTIYRRVNGGKLCICDRYPLQLELRTDGSIFSPEIIKCQKSFIKRFLMNKEVNYYEKMLKPDCFFYLKINPIIALERNKYRKVSYKDEDYLIFRHRCIADIEKVFCKCEDFFTLNTEEETVQSSTEGVIEEIFSRC